MSPFAPTGAGGESERTRAIFDNRQMEDKENYNVTRLVRLSC